MATTSAAPLGPILLTTEGCEIPYESGTEKGSLEQQEAAERKRLHPFFCPDHRTRQSPTSAPPSMSVSCTTPSAGESKSILPVTRRKPESDPVAAPNTQAKKRKGKGKAGTEVGAGLIERPKTELSNNAAASRRRQERDANLPPGGASHSVLPQSNNGVSLDSDPNNSRRKRRKTTSPDVEEFPVGSEQLRPPSNDNASPGAADGYHSFYLQLKAVASNGLSSLNQETIMDASSPIALSEVSLPSLPGSPSTPSRQIIEISPDPVIPDTPPDPPDDHTVPLGFPPPLPTSPADGSLDGKGAQSRKKSPPRKLLRLNAKGKFSSPISKRSESHDRKKTEGKNPPATKKAQKRKVAIVKYGADSDSASLISRKIDNILSSPPRPRLIAVAEKATKPLPLKPTHPFFTGKLGRPGASTPTLSVIGRSSAFGAGIAASGSDTDRGTSLSPLKRTTGKKGASDPDKFSGPTSPKKCMMSPSRTRVLKVPGALEPPWPPNGMLHVRGLDEPSRSEQNRLRHTLDRELYNKTIIPRRERKLKNTLIQVPKAEEVISYPSSGPRVAQQHRCIVDETNDLSGRYYTPDTPRLPERVLTTGRETQKLVRRQMRYCLPSTASSQGETSSTDGSYDSDDNTKRPHPALLALYQSIPASTTPFDRAECETQSWVYKYAPTCAGQVLQSGREALILRDWLRGLTVVSVDTGIVDASNARAIQKPKKLPINGKSKAKAGKKRKKRNEDVDGFIISSDEEANEMDEITDPEDEEMSSGNGSLSKRTVVRVGDPRASGTQTNKLANAIVISGPHGCGKTAAVYAVAKELGFEVFEVNAGSRRSGKDVLEKVGEMTKNHLVHRANGEQADASANDNSTRAAAPQKDLETRKQGSVRSLLKNKSQTASSRRPKRRNIEDDLAEKRKQPQQKQSLILLEEIDILFEEDKQFWATVISLIAQSKRPIIMTCNNESLVPLDTLSLHAILRFVPPPEDLAVDYCLLIAANEGHILRREALTGLYTTKNRDLRASIMEIDYWCQMGIGDRKSGLEWMIERWPPGADVSEDGEKLRVASKNTYVTGMGWLGREACRANDETVSDDEEEILVEAWERWEIDVEDWHERDDMKEWAAEVTYERKKSFLNYTIALNAYETFLESMSAADVYAGQGMRNGNQNIFDPTLPNPPERHRPDDVLGWRVLRSNPLIRYDRTNSQMSAYAKSLAKRVLRNNTLDLHTECQIESLYEQDMIKNIIHLKNTSRSHHHLSHADLAAAFAPIAAPPTFITPQPTHTISSFDRASSLVVTDLAPYVRTIISHELRREEERCRVAGLFLQGGRNGKKIRTTRASRSALADGSRVSMRREKWFDGKISAPMVLRTGGKGWQEAATRKLLRPAEDSYDDVDELRTARKRICQESTEDSEV